MLLLLAAAAALALPAAHASFYLPGVAPKQFAYRDNVNLFVNKLTSTKTQIPFDYYALGYCKHHVKEEEENIGERLSGDNIESSLYKLEMKVPQACEILCKKSLSKADMHLFSQFIDDDYRVHWIVDQLPSALVLPNELDPLQPFYARGFPVGFRASADGGPVESTELKGVRHFLYNHVRIIISYHEDDGPVPAAAVTAGSSAAVAASTPRFEGARIVGFRVEPFSIAHKWDLSVPFDKDATTLTTCNEMSPAENDPSNYQSVDAAADIVFSYDISWEKSELLWAHRWDLYLKGNPDDKIHWFSITNSTMIVVFLTVMVAMILVRTLNRDIAQYNDVAALEEAKEESGWKLVHADVFRPPQTAPMLFAVMVGTGVQLGLMTLATLSFALIGLLSPANRGSLLTAFILIFVFMGASAGYHSSRVYKMFRGADWRKNTLMTAFLYPGLAFVVFFCLDVALLYEGSSGAIPFSTFFTLLVLWFGVSTPLVFVGSYFGFNKDAVSHPVRTNTIPRQIPQQPWYMSGWLTVLFGGVLPFGAVSVELFFIMSALWLHQIYYIFGFLFVVCVILVATCAEITILLCYFQLCNEDYHWWWRAFMSSGSCAAYIFLYGIWYFHTELEITGFVPTVLYFSYMAMISVTSFLLTGTIGYYACFGFLTKIYGSIKVD